MKKRKYCFVITLMLFICLPLFLFSKHVHAATININGLQAQDATITNSQGQVIPNGTSLSNDDYYSISWHWSVPNGTIIKAGDTAHFYLPSNVTVTHNVSFEITNKKGQVVGTATVAVGSHEGTITFNNVLSHDNYDESGTLYMNVKGAQTTPNNFKWMLEKQGCVQNSDIQDGHPQYITWTIYVNPQAQACHNIKIADQIGNDQTFVPGSVVINTGSLDANGDFTASGTFNGADVSTGGNQININIAQCNQTLQITYKTKITNYDDTTENTYGNVVHYQINGSSVQQATSYVKYGGGGTASGYDGQVQLIKEDAQTQQPLAGAVFELVNSQGQVIATNLVTNAQGQINVEELLPGTYSFIETKAPQGYALNSEPHQFTIVRDGTAIVKVVATDNKATVPVISSSSSLTTSSSSTSSLSSLSSVNTTSSSALSSLASTSSIILSSSSVTTSSITSTTTSKASSSAVVSSTHHVPVVNSSSTSQSGVTSTTTSTLSSTATPSSSRQSSNLSSVKAKTSLGANSSAAKRNSHDNTVSIKTSSVTSMNSNTSSSKQQGVVTNNSNSHTVSSNHSSKQYLPQTGEQTMPLGGVFGTMMIAVALLLVC